MMADLFEHDKFLFIASLIFFRLDSFSVFGKFVPINLPSFEFMNTTFGFLFDFFGDFTHSHFLMRDLSFAITMI